VKRLAAFQDIQCKEMIFFFFPNYNGDEVGPFKQPSGGSIQTEPSCFAIDRYGQLTARSSRSY
jgi:hypothetical protein